MKNLITSLFVACALVTPAHAEPAHADAGAPGDAAVLEQPTPPPKVPAWYQPAPAPVPAAAPVVVAPTVTAPAAQLEPLPAGAQLLATISLTLAPVALSLFVWLMLKLRNFIGVKIKNEFVKGVLQRLDDHVCAIVREMEQTLVANLKSQRPDGRLTADDAARAKEAVAAKAKSYLGMKGLDELAQIVGAGNVESYIASKIEATVHAAT